jgi:branched-chain amino acid transport system substrate-binding protein
VQGPFSGQLATYGQDVLNAAKLAVDEWNKQGGLFGTQIEIVEGDDQADPAQAARVAEKFVSDPAIVGMVGPLTSGATNSVLPIVERANLVLITPSATNPDLAKKGFKTFHRVCPTDADQGPALATFVVKDLGAKSVDIIDDKSTYAVGLGDQVEKTLKELGVTKMQRYSITPEDKDFSAVLTKVKADDPDILFTFITSSDQAAALAKQKRSLGIRATQVGGDGLYDVRGFIQGAEGATEGAYVSFIGPDIQSVPEAKQFVSNYKSKFGSDPGTFAAQTYVAVNILLEGVKKAGVKDGKIERKAVLDAVHATKDYKSILGIPISFTPEGNLAGGTIFIFQVKGDRFVQVKSVSVGAK